MRGERQTEREREVVQRSEGMWTSAVETRPRFRATAFREPAAQNAPLNADAAVGM